MGQYYGDILIIVLKVPGRRLRLIKRKSFSCMILKVRA